MVGAETEAHARLKKLAIDWAQEQGFTACMSEVRVPNSGFRADVVAYKANTQKNLQSKNVCDEDGHAQSPSIGTTAIFECKQVRSDFLKDSYAEQAALDRLKSLEQRREKLDSLLGIHLPSLRKGDLLFQEYDSFDYNQYEHKTYQKLIREIGVLKNRIYGKTKFEKLVQYCCVNLYYLVVEKGIIEHHELPSAWGLLVREGESLRLDRRPLWNHVSERIRFTMLQQIASSATRRLNQQRISSVSTSEKQSVSAII